MSKKSCIVALVALLALAGAAGSAAEPPASVVGRYRCWSFNVGGAGRRCTSPPLVLKADGAYEMSSERGTYSVDGSRVILSESKLRGPGRLEDGNRIVFEYEYRGQKHTVTYLRQEE